ncbi:enolase C-terminal domain-like protein [Streptomyces sasae]|uniref:enolase C-terminal domain-like protein n=1 Tax=Streptomyces sasae TaxID=1266772 RepID=UPI003743D5D9
MSTAWACSSVGVCNRGSVAQKGQWLVCAALRHWSSASREDPDSGLWWSSRTRAAQASTASGGCWTRRSWSCAVGCRVRARSSRSTALTMFTTYDEQRQDRQLRGWVAEDGIPRVKIKIGESWGRCEARDLWRVARARESIGDTAELYVDANGGYGAKQAVKVAAGLDGQGVTWFEEPVSSDRLEDLAFVRGRVMADVTAGEYGYALPYFRRMLAAGAVDCLQADVTRCGGITVWLRVAALALSHGLEISGHCAPHAHAHAAASVPILRHLEWFHDHVRIERLLFEGTLDPAAGGIAPGRDGAPGLGLSLDAERARPYRTG